MPDSQNARTTWFTCLTKRAATCSQNRERRRPSAGRLPYVGPRVDVRSNTATAQTVFDEQGKQILAVNIPVKVMGLGGVYSLAGMDRSC